MAPRSDRPVVVQSIHVEDGSIGSDSDCQYAGMPVSRVPAYMRRRFIGKVYSILTIQLAVTFAVASLIRSTRWFAAHRNVLLFASVGTILGTLLVQSCWTEAMRRYPSNYAFLLANTLGVSVLAGFATLMFTTDVVLLAVAATTAVFMALTTYAGVAEIDFTGPRPYLCAGLFSFLAVGLVLALFRVGSAGTMAKSPADTIYAGIGVLIFVAYIIFDTQLIIGGNHRRHQFSIDDYVLAALNLYLNIINLFLKLLQLLGSRR